ncbi:MAG: F0F1 ATP synthase subunit epsilon [Spirochaetia bacterium]|jgi:F-type H+-transporting ATPase subunit epsilon
MSFPFIVRTPDGVAAQGDCDFVVVPTTRGEMGVLADHAPVVASVAPGDLRITAGGRESRIRVGPGLVEVLDNAVKLFVADAGTVGASGDAGRTG